MILVLDSIFILVLLLEFLGFGLFFLLSLSFLFLVFFPGAGGAFSYYLQISLMSKLMAYLLSLGFSSWIFFDIIDLCLITSQTLLE